MASPTRIEAMTATPAATFRGSGARLHAAPTPSAGPTVTAAAIQNNVVDAPTGNPRSAVVRSYPASIASRPPAARIAPRRGSRPAAINASTNAAADHGAAAFASDRTSSGSSVWPSDVRAPTMSPPPAAIATERGQDGVAAELVAAIPGPEATSGVRDR